MKLILLFIPVYIAYFFSYNPVMSYSISWITSLIFIWISIKGWLSPIPKDLPFHKQLFRPYILGQILFFGYNALSSIFFFADALGYYYLDKQLVIIDYKLIHDIAKVQMFTALAHACYLIGLLPKIKDYNRRTAYKIDFKPERTLPTILLLYLVAAILSQSPLAYLAFFCTQLANFLTLFYIIHHFKLKKNLLISGCLLGLLLAAALLSGMKENIIIILLFLLVNLYPTYKLRPIIILAPLIITFFYYYPTLNNDYRKLTWDQGINATVAIDDIFTEENLTTQTYEDNNWQFLTTRLSEMSMLVSYFNYVPQERPYYGLEIITDSFKLLVPRIIFPDKGSPDISAMKRATDAGAIMLNENDYTSAKPQTIADAYMSAGIIGVMLTFFLFGYSAVKISLWCEKIFGGYEIGSVIIFQSFFIIFSKGACFENLIGTLFWSVILVFCLHKFLVYKKVLIKN